MQTVPCFIYSAELSAVDLCAQVIECTGFIVTSSICVHTAGLASTGFIVTSSICVQHAGL